MPVLLGAAAESWQVLSADGASPLLAQLVPASPADAALRTTYYGAASANMSWLVFDAPAALPAAGWTVVFLVPVATAAAAPRTYASVLEQPAPSAGGVLSNGVVTLTFVGSGMLAAFASTSPDSLPSVGLGQALLYYGSNAGDATDSCASGAYIFRPNASESAYPVAGGGGASLTLVRGPVVSEAWQVFAPWASQVIRLAANASDNIRFQDPAHRTDFGGANLQGPEPAMEPFHLLPV